MSRESGLSPRAPRIFPASILAWSCLWVLGCTGLIGDPTGVPSPGLTPPNSETGTASDASAPGVPRLQCEGVVQAARAPMRRITPLQYRNAVQDIFNGRVAPSNSFPAQTRSESMDATGYSTDPERNGVGEATAEQIMIAAEETAEALLPSLSTLLPCATSGANDACATTFISTYARRAFRRTLTANESNALLGLYRNARTMGGDFADGIAAITTAMLQMPNFLYLPEAGTLTANGTRTLNDFELASRLSFLFWDSIPDDDLLRAAEQQQLHTREQLETQARRLLLHERARPALMRFFREWIHIGVLNQGDRANPEFDQTLATAIQESFERFLVTGLREGRSLRTLLTTTEVHVNARLARFYGLPMGTASNDTTWVRANVDEARYAGLTTHPAVMAGLAHDRDPSYVYRGVFVLSRLTCNSLGIPPANAQSEFDRLPLPTTASSVQKSEAVRARPDCAGCHNQIDPIGLAFEGFDEIGRARTMDRHGNTVQTAGQTMFAGPPGISFTNAASLMRSVAATGLCEPCMSRQYLRFTFGRMENREDGCTLQSLTDQLQGAQGSLLNMMIAMATSDAFLARRAQETP